jgi:hypothetical protein
VSEIKIVYFMIGLPSCGKSRTARQLAGDVGLVCETDEFFNVAAADGSVEYDFRPDRLEEARRWNFDRFRQAVDSGTSPIVVDRGNSACEESQRYARYAVQHGYRIELREPQSPWWQEIRVLLKYKHLTGPALDQWAAWLAQKSRATHGVPAHDIRRAMERWRSNLTVEQILNYRKRGTHHDNVQPHRVSAAA